MSTEDRFIRTSVNKVASFSAALLLSGAAAWAATFTNDFSNPNNTTGFTLNGSAPAGSSWMPVITNGVLQLTPNLTGLGGSIILNDEGLQIEAFTAYFKLQFGPGSGNPADGASFVFGQDEVPGSIYGEEGPGAPNQSIVVSFDTYDNGGNEAPAVDVFLFGDQIAHHSFAKSDMVTSKLEDVFVQLKRNGTLSVSYKGQPIYSNLYLPGWGPAYGPLGINARTGGESEETDIDNLGFTTVPAGAPVAPTIVTQPQSITVNEGSSTTFTFDFDGTAPNTFQWAKNGVDIPNATNNTYTLAPVRFSDNTATFTVKVTNAQGTITSGQATLTVNADTTAPTLVSADGSGDFRHVSVNFSEPVDSTTAQSSGNYTIQGLTVNAAVLSPNGTNVILTTTLQTEGASYTLKVSGVKDQSTAGNTIVANSSANFVAWVAANGICKADYYNNIGGTAVSALTADPRYPNAPDSSVYIVGFDVSEGADNYGARVTGWIIPPSSGGWDFFIRSDDASQFFLSSDETPDHLPASPTCEETGCCKAFLEPGNTTEPSVTTAAPITLTGGNRYYFLALLKEGGGGDYVQVAMRKSGDTTPAANLRPISGSSLAAGVSPVGATLTINQQPQDTQVVEGRTATVSVGATGSSVIGSTVLYQWKKNGTDIAGATASSYVTPILAVTDSGAQYSVVVSVPGKTLTSSTATVTVIGDIFPPVPLVGTILNASGNVQVGIGFDEAVNPATLVSGNFTLIGGTGTFRLATNSLGTYNGVVLDTTGLTAGNTYQVTVKNVADLKGNAIGTTNVSFTVGTVAWNDTGTPARPGQVVPVGSDGFDILNGGRQEWASYDEATFAHVIKTNDFDVKVQVMYAEPGSQWTRVGLMARNDLNILEPADDRNSSSSTASAYAQTHVNPSQTLGSSGVWDPNDPVQPGNNTPNNGHEQNQRLTRGGQTSGWGSPAQPPTYPNAWLRLQRRGPVLRGFRSTDGVNWVDQATTSLTDQQNFMYVGPFLAVETGNIWSGTPPDGYDVWNSPFDPKFQRLFLAQFRNFADVTAGITPTTIAVARSGNSVVISWGVAGVLVQSPVVGTGANWTPTPGAPNTPTGGSVTLTPSQQALYFRLQQQ